MANHSCTGGWRTYFLARQKGALKINSVLFIRKKKGMYILSAVYTVSAKPSINFHSYKIPKELK